MLCGFSFIFNANCLQRWLLTNLQCFLRISSPLLVLPHMGLLVVQAGHSNAQELQPTAEASSVSSHPILVGGSKKWAQPSIQTSPPRPLPQFGQLRTFWCSTIQTCCSHSSSFTKALRLERKLLQNGGFWLLLAFILYIYIIYSDNLTMILDYDTDSRIWSIFFVTEEQMDHPMIFDKTAAVPRFQSEQQVRLAGDALLDISRCTASCCAKLRVGARIKAAGGPDARREALRTHVSRQKKKGWKTVQPPKSVTTWMTVHHYFLCLVPSSLLQSSWSLESALNVTAGPLRSALLSSSCAKMGDRNAKVLPEPERKIDSPCISNISLLVWVLLRLSTLSASRS